MLAICLAAGAAPRTVFAQTPAAAAPVADPNITPYAPEFFAEYRPVTALDMIGRIPGFQFDGGTSARGFAGTAGNVLIDGERPPTRSDALSTVLSRIPASQVLRIDIVRAGAGGIDMQGKVVVANVIRRPDGGVTGAVTTGLAFTDQGRLQPSVSAQIQRQRDGRSMDGSIRYSAGSQETDSTRERRTPAGDLLLIGLDDGEVDYASGEATGVYEGPLAGGRVRANALINYNGSQYQSTDRLIFPGGVEDNASDSVRWRGEAGLRWTRSLPHGMNLEMVGFQSITQDDYDSIYDTPSFTSRSLGDERAGESIVSAAVKFAPLATAWGEVSLETGSEVALNWVDSGTAYTFNDSPLLLPGDDTRVEELRNESFITGLWAARPNLSIEANLRYELSRITASGTAGGAETTLDFLKPRLVATWTPRPRDTVTLRIVKTVEQLSFGAFTASAAFSTGIFGRGNPDIQPAQIWASNARYEHLVGTQGSFVVEYLHEDFDDVLGATVVYEIPPGGTVPVPFNIVRNVGEARRDRVTLSSRQPLDGLGLTGGLLSGQIYYRWSNTQDPVTLLDRRLSGEQAVGWSLSLSQNLTAQRITLSASASSGLDSRGYAPSTLSNFHSNPTFSLGVSYRPDPKLSISGGLYIGSDSESDYTLFSAPRGVGVPLYTETSRTPGSSQVYLNLRRSF